MTIEVRIDIEEQRITDMLTSALEGGIPYWADIHKPSTDRSGAKWPSEAPMAGGHFNIILAVGDDINGEKLWRVDKQSCAKGLTIMSQKYPKHFANFMAENDDAETGDVFLQCVCFGELIFG